MSQNDIQRLYFQTSFLTSCVFSTDLIQRTFGDIDAFSDRGVLFAWKENKVVIMSYYINVFHAYSKFIIISAKLKIKMNRISM